MKAESETRGPHIGDSERERKRGTKLYLYSNFIPSFSFSRLLTCFVPLVITSTLERSPTGQLPGPAPTRDVDNNSFISKTI